VQPFLPPLLVNLRDAVDLIEVGMVFMFVEWAILSPLATMPPTAFTMFSAEAFCSAEPARATLSFVFVLICPLSAAMLVAVALAVAASPSGTTLAAIATVAFVPSVCWTVFIWFTVVPLLEVLARQAAVVI